MGPAVPYRLARLPQPKFAATRRRATAPRLAEQVGEPMVSTRRSPPATTKSQDLPFDET